MNKRRRPQEPQRDKGSYESKFVGIVQGYSSSQLLPAHRLCNGNEAVQTADYQAWQHRQIKAAQTAEDSTDEGISYHLRRRIQRTAQADVKPKKLTWFDITNRASALEYFEADLPDRRLITLVTALKVDPSHPLHPWAQLAGADVLQRIAADVNPQREVAIDCLMEAVVGAEREFEMQYQNSDYAKQKTSHAKPG